MIYYLNNLQIIMIYMKKKANKNNNKYGFVNLDKTQTEEKVLQYQLAHQRFRNFYKILYQMNLGLFKNIL